MRVDGFARAKSGLIIPPNILDATEEFDTVSPREAARHGYEAIWFREELKSLDPSLDLIFVKPGSRVFPESPRFYITKYREHTNDAFWVIQDENGNYCPPDQRHLDRFMQGDTHRNPRLRDEYQKTREMRKRRAAKRKAELLDQFEEMLLERLDFVFDGPGLHVTGAHKEKLGA